MLTMRPLSLWSMRRTAARETRNTLVRSHAMTWFQSSSLSSQVSFEPPVIPALFTTMSSRPQRAWAAPTARSTSSVRVTSATSASAEAPIWPAAASTADLSRSTSAMLAPSAESRRAIASPIPRAAPVTSATRPLKLIVPSPFIHMRASAGGAPAPRRPAARTAIGAPRPAGPQPRDGLQRALPCLRQRLPEILDQVVCVLEADREPQEILRRARAGTLDRRAVLDQALRAAEAGGAREHAELGRDVHSASPIAADLHRYHSTERAHLTARDIVRGVGDKPGIVHGLHPRMSVQEGGDAERVVRVAAYPVRQGSDSPAHEPAVNGEGTAPPEACTARIRSKSSSRAFDTTAPPRTSP